jgi:hypothetical protein
MFFLGITTTAGPFISLIMPDIFAGTLILSFAVAYVMWRQLSIYEKISIVGALLFSLLVHSSHIALAIFLFGLLVIDAAATHSLKRHLRLFVIIGSSITVSIVAVFAYNGVIRYMTGKDAVLLPMVMAHIIDMGPGDTFVKRDCSNNQYVICRYRDKLPQDWIAFMFEKNDNRDLQKGGGSGGVYANADDETRRLLSREQLSFFFAVFQSDPAGVIRGMSRDALRQIGRFSLVDLQPLESTI